MPIYSYKLLVVLCVLFLLSACNAAAPKDRPVKSDEFQFKNIAKTDIDMVAEVSVRHSMQYLRELARKLYLRNPESIRRAGFAGSHEIDAAVDGLFAFGAKSITQRSAAAITLALQTEYGGDRVAALIYGMRTMLFDAYGGEGEFYILHTYDPQKLYYLARNFEIAFWRLRNTRDGQGNLLILSTGVDEQGILNLSFSSLFGKLVALQDHFAYVVADTTNRRIKNVMQGLIQAAFFPI